MTTKKNNRTTRTCSFGVLTPSGMRRIDLPDDGQDLWNSIDSYDRAHGTRIYDLYDAEHGTNLYDVITPRTIRKVIKLQGRQRTEGEHDRGRNG